jgi:ketosteroid isomerase-like protein
MARTGVFIAMAMASALVGLPAQAQQSLRAPDWARAVLVQDTEAMLSRNAALQAQPGEIAIRMTIAPVQGGVARLIRYQSGQDPMRVRRFTGHPRNGWMLWGGEAPAIVALDAERRTRLDAQARAALNAAVIMGEGSSARDVTCQDGDLVWLEVADGARSMSFERRCSLDGAIGMLASNLSGLAGSRDEEELFQSGLDDLMARDREFASVAAREGVGAAFAAFAADDAKVFLARQPVLIGHTAIASQYAGWNDAVKLSWAPDGADLSARGDMGLTWGRWSIKEDGKPEISGKYVTTWRRDGEGAWKYTTHMGN